MQKTSKIAKELLTNNEEFNYYESIAYGDLDILHEIFDRSDIKLKVSHPLNKCATVLNALDRESKRKDALFIKEYFRSYRGLARVFTLKN